MDALQFPIENLEETRSRRSYNCYRVSYPSLYSPSLELKTQLVIETYIALLPFPTVQRMTDNYIYRFLKLTDQINLAEEFNLMPFEITTQAIERTLIDKVFAICDYYLSNKVDRHSRQVMNHQFNWWFDYAPIRGLCLQRLKGGCLKHLYRLASKRGYLLVSSLFDSSFCC